MQSPDAAVSSETEELILVDGDDNVVKLRGKDDCHDGKGLRYRACSVFLFDGEGGEMISNIEYPIRNIQTEVSTTTQYSLFNIRWQSLFLHHKMYYEMFDAALLQYRNGIGKRFRIRN